MKTAAYTAVIAAAGYAVAVAIVMRWLADAIDAAVRIDGLH